MNADDIKCVTQLEVCRVLGMVAVDELLLLDLHTGHTAGFNQMPAVLVIGRLIYIG